MRRSEETWIALALAAIVSIGTPACGSEAGGTAGMVDRLDSMRSTIEPSRNRYVNDVRADSLRAGGLVARSRGPTVRARLLAEELLRAGQWEEGIGVLEDRLDALREQPGNVAFGLEQSWRKLRSALHVRHAVELACVDAREPAQCRLAPESPGAGAGAREARAAARLLREALEAQPQERQSRWLLNLAEMYAGGYPDEVPERWRVPPSSFESEGELGRFRDRAPALGVDVHGHAGGGALEDFDGDGDLDLIASSWFPGAQLRYFENRGDGTFAERTEAAGLTGLTGGLNLKQADYDNDGDVDVLVLRGGWQSRGWPNSLLRNDGDGTFTDVTERAGLLTFHPTQTAAWADYDGDGDLDLFVGNETRPDPVALSHPSRLYRNEGDGTFAEVTEAAGVATAAYVKGVDWGDVDGDGRPDLYVSVLGGSNRLYRNRGPGEEGTWRFEEMAGEAGVTGPARSFGAGFLDVDNDGDLDLYLSPSRLEMEVAVADYTGNVRPDSAGSSPVLYRNRGDGTFAEVTAEVGLDRPVMVMGSNFGDLDGDGYPDLLLGTGNPDMRSLLPTRAFRNRRGERFVDVTTAGGLGHIGKGAGVSFGDVDNDGDQDVHVVYGGAYAGDVFRNALYENPGHGHGWLTLRLVGEEANRAGVGARIRVVVETPGGGEREVYVTAGTGASFGASSLQQEIGLGEAERIRSVRIEWPGSGTVDVHRDVEMGRIYRAREGADRLEAVDSEPMELASGSPPAAPDSGASAPDTSAATGRGQR